MQRALSIASSQHLACHRGFLRRSGLCCLVVLIEHGVSFVELASGQAHFIVKHLA